MVPDLPKTLLALMSGLSRNVTNGKVNSLPLKSVAQSLNQLIDELENARFRVLKRRSSGVIVVQPLYEVDPNVVLHFVDGSNSVAV
jgi:hypothetical protein